MLVVCVILAAFGGRVLGYLAGAVLLGVLPGWLVLGHLLPRRACSAGARVVMAAGLSMCAAPVLLDALWRWTHDGQVMLVVWVAVLVGLGLILPAASRERVAARLAVLEGAPRWGWAAVACAWLGFWIVAAYWPGMWDDAPLLPVVHDFVKHHAVLFSLERRPLPLGNVFFAPAADEPHYYYHYFYLVPATLRLWTGGRVSIELAFGLHAAWVALTVVGLTVVLARRVGASGGQSVAVAVVTALVGGLDVIPAAALAYRLGHAVVTLDAWQTAVPYRVHNLANHMLWSPQHVHGLGVVLTAAVVASMFPRGRVWLWLGPVMGTALLGSSAQLAMVVLPAAGLWATAEAIRARRWWPVRYAVPALGWVGLATCVLGWPLVAGYWEMAGRYGGGLTWRWPENPAATLGRLVPPGPLANVLELPTLAVVDLGFRAMGAAAIGVVGWRRVLADPGMRMLVWSAVVGTAGMVVLRSDVHEYDYGLKVSMLVTMSVLAVAAGLAAGSAAPQRWWCAWGWESRRWWVRAGLTGSLIAGLAVGVYELPGYGLRRWANGLAVLRGSVQGAPDAEVVGRVLAERGAYGWLRQHLPEEAVVQAWPRGARAYLVRVAHRVMGVLDPGDSDVGVFRPPDPARMARAFASCLEAGASGDGRRLWETLRGLGVTHLFVGRLEREKWLGEGGARLADGVYFRQVYADGGTAIYEVRAEASEDQRR